MPDDDCSSKSETSFWLPKISSLIEGPDKRTDECYNVSQATISRLTV